MSNDKLAEALRDLRTVLLDDSGRCTLFIPLSDCRMIDRALAVIGAHAAEAAQAKAQSGEWVMVPRIPTEAMMEAAFNTDDCPDGPSSTPDFNAAYVAMLAAAPQLQTAEPVAWLHPDYYVGHPYPDECISTDARSKDFGWLPLYTTPQPAQERPCTCHPDDNPPVPCPQRFAFSECVKAAQDAKDAALLEWAARRWRAEVMDRPLVNVHRRPLDDVWRQVIRHAGGDDVVICGPRHDDLVVMAKESGR